MFVTESVENVEPFVGRMDMRYGEPTQIDYYRTHPPLGGIIYTIIIIRLQYPFLCIEHYQLRQATDLRYEGVWKCRKL